MDANPYHGSERQRSGESGTCVGTPITTKLEAGQFPKSDTIENTGRSLLRKAPPDPTQVDGCRGTVRLLCRYFATRERLREAVSLMGSSVTGVRAYLRRFS